MPEGWKKANVTLVIKGQVGRHLRLQASQSHLSPQKGRWNSYLEAISKHVEDEMISSSQHRFIKGKSC